MLSKRKKQESVRNTVIILNTLKCMVMCILLVSIVGEHTYAIGCSRLIKELHCIRDPNFVSSILVCRASFPRQANKLTDQASLRSKVILRVNVTWRRNERSCVLLFIYATKRIERLMRVCVNT